MKRFGVRVYKDYFKFASSHFLLFEDGSREELHGHNYQVRVAVQGEVGADDMVLDFGRLKPIVRRFCDALDHRVLLPERNERLKLTLEDDHIHAAFARPDGGRDRFLFPRRDVVLLPIRNTSTERLAEHLAGQILRALRDEVPGVPLSAFEIEVEEAGGQCGVCAVEPIEDGLTSGSAPGASVPDAPANGRG